MVEVRSKGDKKVRSSRHDGKGKIMNEREF
jgi:hypothetical protein